MPPAFTRPPLSALVAVLGLALFEPCPAHATDFVEAELHYFGIATGPSSTFMAFPDTRRGQLRMYMQRLDEFGVPQWPDTAVQVGIGGRRETWPMVAADAQGGAWVAWQSSDDTNGVSVKLASFAEDGHRRWLTVLPMKSRSRSNFSRPVAMFPGPSGSLTLAYADDWTTASWMQRFDAGGAPILPGSGIALPFPSTADIHGRLVSDDAGGVFVLGGFDNLYLDHVDAAGAHAWGTPGVRANGLEPASAPRVLSDGHGGAYVAWVAGVADVNHPSHSPVRVQHIAEDGSLLWDPAGLRVSDQPADSPVLVSDGQGGVIAIAMGASWASYTYAQRFSSSGERAWGDGGILLALTSQLPREPMVASDPAGGVLLLWIGFDQLLRAQHLNADGRLALPQAGKPILELPADTFDEIGVPDGAGGIVMGSGFVFSPFTARRIASTGDLLWPTDGSAVFAGVDRQLAPKSIPDGAGGVIVAGPRSDAACRGSRSRATTPRVHRGGRRARSVGRRRHSLTSRSPATARAARSWRGCPSSPRCPAAIHTASASMRSAGRAGATPASS
jgi:hypothetical protein